MRFHKVFFLTALVAAFGILTVFSPAGAEKTLSPDSIPIAYSVKGGGSPALVFVHGWCCDRGYWKFQVPLFAKRYKVVAVDLAGHGESGLDRGEWTIAAYGEDVVAVVEKLDLEKVVLIGHSMGGPVILEAARHIPERVIGLVGVDSYHDLESEYTQEQRDRFVAPFEADFRATTMHFVRGMFRPDADSALVAAIAADMSSAPPGVGISSMKSLAGYRATEALKEVRVPIYSINSDLFPTNVEAGKRSARFFDVRYMKGPGHFLMMEDPGGFNRLLQEILDELQDEE